MSPRRITKTVDPGGARKLRTLMTSDANCSLFERGVRFSEENNTIHLIELLDDIEEEVILAVWYTEDESSDMKNNAYLAVAAIDDGHEDVETRGLENQTRDGAWTSY
jgi:hypothetical protein